MYHQIHNGGLVTVEDISYISTIQYGFKIFYYKIAFKSGYKLDQELILNWKDSRIFESHNDTIYEKLDEQDYRNCSFYRNFENSYNELVEKYKKYNEQINQIDTTR